MENLVIESTNKTPGIDFNANGTIRIKGRSIPEDAGLFYNHLYSWIFRYCMQPSHETNISLELEYMNSGSAKSILQLLRELLTITQHTCHKINIYWHYELGDEDMLEKGEYFEYILKYPFIFVETD
jgi:hypothetical protein